MNTEDKHIECISDFCGNLRSPGAWADIFEKEDGTRYVALGGGWEFYGEKTPQVIPDSDPLYQPFLDACEAGEDFGFARLHWS